MGQGTERIEMDQKNGGIRVRVGQGSGWRMKIEATAVEIAVAIIAIPKVGMKNPQGRPRAATYGRIPRAIA
jgi:hypothetical protein